MAETGLKPAIPSVLIYGVLGAAAGAIGTLAIQRLIPEPKPGDGFSVRFLDATGIERRLDFGPDEKGALERAIELAPKFSGVEVIKIKNGRVEMVMRAGVPAKS